MLESYERGEVTPPPTSSYGGSPGLLALHSSLYGNHPNARGFDIDSVDNSDGSMAMDAQILPVNIFLLKKKKDNIYNK